MAEKRSSLRFSGRRHSRNGMIATVIGGIAWMIFIALCVYSTAVGGNAESIAGILGLLDALFAVIGIFLSVKGFRERDVYFVLPMVGTALNSILFIVYFSLYFMGMALR